MKIFIPSKGRAKTIVTHKTLEWLDYKIVLHNEEEKSLYLKNSTVPPEKIVVANIPFGMSVIMQWIKDNLVERGEWYLKLDDNIRGFYAYPEPYYSQEKIEFDRSKADQVLRHTLEDNKVSAIKMVELLQETIKEAERIGAKFCGISHQKNYFFKERKYKTVGYVCGKLVLIKNEEAQFDQNIKAMDDYGFTSENLVLYKRILINNFLYPDGGHYEQGGCGTYSERTPQKIADSKYIIDKYPGLWRYKAKKGCHPEAELAIRFNESSLNRLDEWREQWITRNQK